MKKIIKIGEEDLLKIIKKILKEQVDNPTDLLKHYIRIYDEIYLPAFENFKHHGAKKIKRPTSTNISQKTFALLYMIDNIGRVVSKEEITKEYIKLTNKHTNDFQSVRHLGSQDGYDITNNRGGINGYRLNSLGVRGGFIPDRRSVEISNDDWIDIKNEYDNRCATCGDEEGKPQRYDKTTICTLQMGHMNPKKPLTLDNVIPHCAICNSVYKDKFRFNKYGRVIGTA
jgi:hypothetical protein